MTTREKKPGAGRIRPKGFQSAGAKAPDRAADVVTMIAALTDEKGEAKAPDLALRLGVSTATVVKALAHLRERDLVFEEEGRIGLTGNGWKQAEDTERRLRAMEAFLLSLGVSERTARSDATRLAPLASEETVRAMARFLARKMG